MKTVNDLLNKFNNEVFISSEDKSITSQNGWKVSYSIELANNMHDIKRLPVQIVVRISKDGTHVQTWGCDSNSEQSCFVEWFVKKSADAFSTAMKLDRAREQEAKNGFKNM